MSKVAYLTLLRTKKLLKILGSWELAGLIYSISGQVKHLRGHENYLSFSLLTWHPTQEELHPGLGKLFQQWGTNISKCLLKKLLTLSFPGFQERRCFVGYIIRKHKEMTYVILLRMCTLVSYGCHNKVPQTEIYSLTVLEARSLKSRCWQGWYLL